MARVLVTDAEERAALAVVRSLGRGGHQVSICSPRRRPLAGASRFARDRALVPDPLTAPAAYADALHRLVGALDIDVLLPMSEASLMALLPERERLGPVALPFPSAAAFERIRDKAEVLEAARRLGIGVPAQRVAACAAEAPDPATLRFPVVLKPARSVIDAGGGRAKSAVAHAADAAEYAAAIRALPAGAYPLLVQQRIVGPGAGIFLLVWDGRPLAAFGHRRLREKPPSGGVSVYRESAPVDDRLLALSLELLCHFDWQGVAMVEYKLDAATGTPYLMEINGRFWGSLQLAIDAGVDFPALLVDCASGMPPDPVTGYRLGVRSRWWWGDVDHLIARVRAGDGAAAALRTFLGTSFDGARNEVLRWNDPAPGLRETLDWLQGR
jgi:predicted ATP-grasp superfamily ATP-dependent carboligase